MVSFSKISTAVCWLCWLMGDVSGKAVPASLVTYLNSATATDRFYPPPKTLMSFSYFMLRNNKCSPLLGSFLRQSQAASRLPARPTPSVRFFGIFSKRDSGRICQSLDKRVFQFPTSKGITPLFASFKRGIVTDSQAIMTRPTGRDAWIRYAVAGVGLASFRFLPSRTLFD